MPQKSHKIFIVAGEASGGNYGALFAREAGKIKDVEIRGWGGDEMASEGVTITKHYNALAFMGFWEVLKNLRTSKILLERYGQLVCVELMEHSGERISFTTDLTSR